MRPAARNGIRGRPSAAAPAILLHAVLLSAALLPAAVRSVESPTDPKLQYKVNCNDEYMTVDIKKTDDIKFIYLNQLKFYPELACQPVFEKNLIQFKLSLLNVFQCGLTKVTNQGTGTVTYYHQIVIEKDGGPHAEIKSFVNVKCWFSGPRNHTMTKRNVLPAGFQEQEDLEISGPVEGKAPVPMLKVGVRQGGSIVNGELNVNPGTPLQMEIYLDKESAMLYGLLVSYMQVTDTKAQEETIIFNGCSVDPYLFENFNTVDGDFLTAKFRAFKFPESTYVQFKGTVNVCLDKCRGVDCSNGKIGFGRKRREISGIPPDPNKIFEVSMTTFIKVDYKNEMAREKVKLDVGVSDERNRTADDGQQLDTRPKNGDAADGNDRMRVDTEDVREELKYTLLEAADSAGRRRATGPSRAVAAAVVVASVVALLATGRV